jgi:thiol-disulfide isomerase/thioredoxin
MGLFIPVLLIDFFLPPDKIDNESGLMTLRTHRGGPMKKVYIFGKPSCPVCKDAVNKINYFRDKGKFDAEIKYFDMETLDGLSEGSYFEVFDIPTVVIFEEQRELARWVKKPPISEEFLPYLI